VKVPDFGLARAVDGSSGSGTCGSGRVTPLLDGGTYARYAPTGHLVYLRNGALMATPFDPGSLTASEARPSS
jgi:hypothetical protein